jgi:quinol monooxygenase YgiN
LGPSNRAVRSLRGKLLHCFRFQEALVVAVVWQIEVAPDQSEPFERFYGADGEWTKLSRRSRSFLGSSFLRDLAHPERYLLVEYWSEMVVYEKHLADFGSEVQSLEDERNRFVVRMEAMGVFTALDVPDRVGPTWSRRSG